MEDLVRHERKCCVQFWVLKLKEKLIQRGNEAQKSGRWPEPVSANKPKPIAAEFLLEDEQLLLAGGNCELPDSPGAVPLPVLAAPSSKATQRGTGGSPCHQLLWHWVRCDLTALPA